MFLLPQTSDKQEVIHTLTVRVTLFIARLILSNYRVYSKFRAIPRRSLPKRHVDVKFLGFENNKKEKERAWCPDAAHNKCLKIVVH